ncbi:MAG: hypothetical protein COW63_13635, partial [Bacteroidetes bacterium CG18_big_fil_WC_8_21_14_2_50_41_14]
MGIELCDAISSLTSLAFIKMDLPIKKKKGIKRKHILIGVGVLVVGLLSFQAFFRTNVSTLNVDIEKLSVEQVSEGI